MPFRFATWCIRRMVPAMMLRPNSGLSWATHHGRTWFFISHLSQISFRIFWHFGLLFSEAKSPCDAPPRKCIPRPSQFRICLPFSQPVFVCHNRHTHHSCGRDDTHSGLSLHCYSLDRPHQDLPISEINWYRSTGQAFWMTCKIKFPLGKSSFNWWLKSVSVSKKKAISRRSLPSFLSSCCC